MAVFFLDDHLRIQLILTAGTTERRAILDAMRSMSERLGHPGPMRPPSMVCQTSRPSRSARRAFDFAKCSRRSREGWARAARTAAACSGAVAPAPAGAGREVERPRVGLLRAREVVLGEENEELVAREVAEPALELVGVVPAREVGVAAMVLPPVPRIRGQPLLARRPAASSTASASSKGATRTPCGASSGCRPRAVDRVAGARSAGRREALRHAACHGWVKEVVRRRLSRTRSPPRKRASRRDAAVGEKRAVPVGSASSRS